MIQLTLISILISLSQCQNFYGPSQLDLYFRLLRARNFGGFGFLDNAAPQIATLERQQLLSGLPPLPMTHDEVLHVLTTEAPTTTQKATARPTTPAPQVNQLNVDNAPENPPIAEERIGGTYDEDGNFISATNQIVERKRNVVRGARNYQLSDTATTHHHFGYEPQFHQPVHQTQDRFIRQHTMTTPTPASTYPPLIFRAKPQPSNRESYLNNLLLEIEEYDDFLDQVKEYKERHPGARVPNPYRELPEGKLPALAQYRR